MRKRREVSTLKGCWKYLFIRVLVVLVAQAEFLITEEIFSAFFAKMLEAVGLLVVVYCLVGIAQIFGENLSLENSERLFDFSVLFGLPLVLFFIQPVVQISLTWKSFFVGLVLFLYILGSFWLLRQETKDLIAKAWKKPILLH